MITYPTHIQDHLVAREFRKFVDAFNALEAQTSQTASELSGIQVPTLAEIQAALQLGGSSPLNVTGLLGQLSAAQSYAQIGTFAARPGFSAVPVGTIYFATDQSTAYITTGTAWDTISRRFLIGGFYGIFSHANTANRTYTFANEDGNIVYESSALTAGAIVLGSGGAKVKPGTLGTTTTVLHGNAVGDPSYGSVSLTADVSGVLPLANGGAAGASGSVTLFGPSTNGSLTFANGLITAFVAPT